MDIRLSPFVPERIWSREMGLAVSSRVSLLILHTQAESSTYLRDSFRFPRRRPFIYEQPGKVANPARGQLNKKDAYFPVSVRA